MVPPSAAKSVRANAAGTVGAGGRHSLRSGAGRDGARLDLPAQLVKRHQSGAPHRLGVLGRSTRYRTAGQGGIEVIPELGAVAQLPNLAGLPVLDDHGLPGLGGFGFGGHPRAILKSGDLGFLRNQRLGFGGVVNCELS